MSRRYAPLVGALVLVPLLSSCSHGEEHSAKQFDTVVTGKRLFEAYRQSKNATTTADVPRSTSELVISMDCVNSKGAISVALTNAAGLNASGDVPCTEESHPGGTDGAITIGLGSKHASPSVKIVVTAPKGSEWSAAVDSRTAD
jgi:hypothetical protein